MVSGTDFTIKRKTVSIAISLLFVFVLPMISSSVMGVSSAGQPRSCLNSWSVGDGDNITTSDGTFAVTVEKISSNSAIFVEDGQIVSSTILNDIVSNWESIIFPTTTNFFGDPPDIDGNCQIEIALLSVDGSGGTGGFFVAGALSIRETIVLDVDDLEDRNSWMPYSLADLIHHSNDPNEYKWVTEGTSEFSEFVSFGATTQLHEGANSWTQNSSSSLRWWDGRPSDRGASFLFFTYLSDKLGGATGISQLVSDSSIGGNGIENLARNPGPGSTPIGSTMSEIFANFSAAITLDSDQGAFGFSEIELQDDCSAGGFCKAVSSAENDEWSEVWQSSGHSLEGWGLKSFKFTGGDGYPLSILVQPDRFGFEGALLSKEESTGTWTMDRIRIDSEDGRGTGLVNGFGNLTSEVWLLVWYNSLVDDCDFDFANCGVLSGGNYPTGTFSVSASQVTSPAELAIETVQGFDRDGVSFGGATAFLAKISSDDTSVDCAILIPDLTRHVEVIEVIADVFLRESLNLKDGSIVHLNLSIG